MKMPAMFIIMILVYLGAHFYVFFRLWRMMPPSTVGHTILICAGALAFACSILWFLIGGKVPYGLGSVIYKVGTSWMIILLYLLLILLATDLLKFTHLIPAAWMRNGSWTTFASLVAIVSVVMVAGNIVYHNKKKVEINVATDRWHVPEQPMRIVAVSDLHLGYGIGKKEVAKWVDMINGEQPDLILIVGDMIDSHIKPLYETNMAEELRRLDAPLGVYAVPGNHEYISGITDSDNFYATTGITLLRDSVAQVDGRLYIVGRDDASNKERKPLTDLTASLDRRLPEIVLDHQPYHLEESAEAGATLQLSGHTHRGQIWPVSWITDMIFEKSYGLYKKDKTTYYISSGLGIWGGKFRIGTRSEYVVVNLVPEE